jgi:hypothetical protein
MRPMLLNRLANDLRSLRALNQHDPQPIEEVLETFRPIRYAPADMSDTENFAVWADFIHHARQYGITIDMFREEVGIGPLQVQQWENGVAMPRRVAVRKDIYVFIFDLLQRQHSCAP